MSGPSAAAPVFAAAATSDARRAADSRIISVSAAVAVPIIRPADTPDRTLAGKSQPGLEAKMNKTALAALKPREAAITGLRPT